MKQPAERLVPPASGKPRRLGRGLLMLTVPAALALGGGLHWATSGRIQTTENAALHQARITVASDLSGRVVKVAIHDNQAVKAGDLLFQVDPEPLQLAVNDALVAVDAARLSVEQLKVAYAQALAMAKVAQEEARFAQGELSRQGALQRNGVTTAISLDDAKHAALLVQDQADVADQAVANALAAPGDPALPTDRHPRGRAALVQLDKARYALGQTQVHAPADGIGYQAASFREGQKETAGAALFAVEAKADAWMDGNFKETQLTGVKVGQPAQIVFDMRPGKVLSGKVEAMGAGTGAEFSLLPAQNATGNWVKVSQRVPVRIRLDEPQRVADLASGVSTSVDVDTGRGLTDSDLLRKVGL